MPRLPPLPDLAIDALAPVSRTYGDVYFSGDGLAEKREVFLRGCGLPAAWKDRRQFTVAELGFGSGLNLLALWQAWRIHRPSPAAQLHVMSFEAQLMTADTAGRIHSAWPELAGLSACLCARWPDRAYGAQRIVLGDGVRLTLFIGEAAASLRQADGLADAWFLDGFAPSKNPDMWSQDVLAEVARLSAPEARLASYTVAGQVRRTLTELGFQVEKVPGHGRKKERLEARRLPSAALPLPPPPPRPQRIAVIGAGVAGAWAARACLDRGLEVDVYETADRPAAGASGNPLALVMPRLDAADSPQARALLAAWLMARRAWPAQAEAAVTRLDAHHRPRGDREKERFSRLMSDPPLERSILSPETDGLVHHGALAIDPRRALPLLLEGAQLHVGCTIETPAQTQADLVIVCAGMGAVRFNAPPLEGRLGQVESRPDPGEGFAIADGGYVVRALGELVFGATFEAADGGEARISEHARAHNRDVLARLRPDICADGVSSRASIRATTGDRLPFAGAAGASLDGAGRAGERGGPACRMIGGLGSRGFLWAPLLAELIISEALGEPLPLERQVAACLNPQRFAQRAARRGLSQAQSREAKG